MRITLFDYGAGNLHSLSKALAAPGDELCVSTDPVAALDTDVLVLPGVGGFAAAAERFAGGREAMRDAILGGLPTIGICLGMQLLFEESTEGEGRGLGVIDGSVDALRARRVPQIGWNDVTGPDAALAASGFRTAYYANSFVCRPADESIVTAWTTHEDDRFPAMLRMDRTIGMQFHPEKSSSPGVRLLRQCLREVTR